jgi:trimeric autotransporter adhesin
MPFAVVSSAPVAKITSASLADAADGSGNHLLSLTGTDFVASSVVKWRGLALSTGYVSPWQVTAVVSASEYAAAAGAVVTVTNPSGTSAGFMIAGVSQPTITSLSSTSATAGSSAVTLSINGSGFVASSTVTYKGVAHAAAFVSASQLSMTLSASDLATAGSFPIVVTNPGGLPSNSVNFTVTAGGGGVLPNKGFDFTGTMMLQGASLPLDLQVNSNGDGTYLVTLIAGNQVSGLNVASQFNSVVTPSGANAVYSGPCPDGTCVYTNLDTGSITFITFTNLTMKFNSFADGSTATGTATFSPGAIQGTFTGTILDIHQF